MDSRKLTAGVCFASLACGLLGGALGAWLCSFFSGNNPNPTFQTVTVTDALIVTSQKGDKAGCKLLPDGTATMTGGLVANQVRGQVFSGQNFIASTNPLDATLEEQRIMAQMVADPNSGGQLIVRGREATFVPAQGAPDSGTVAVVAFNRENGKAEIFTQDLAAGEAGRAFMLSMRPRPARPPASPPNSPPAPADHQDVTRSATAPPAADNAAGEPKRDAEATPPSMAMWDEVAPFRE